jgi:hypothetical protein
MIAAFRSLLAVGAVLTTMSVAACAKPAAGSADSPSAPAMSDAADNSAAMDAAAAASADAK